MHPCATVDSTQQFSYCEPARRVTCAGLSVECRTKWHGRWTQAISTCIAWVDRWMKKNLWPCLLQTVKSVSMMATTDIRHHDVVMIANATYNIHRMYPTTHVPSFSTTCLGYKVARLGIYLHVGWGINCPWRIKENHVKVVAKQCSRTTKRSKHIL